MTWSSAHMPWLKPIRSKLATIDGKEIKLFEFKPNLSDSSTMSAWAKHFRNHYCLDDEIDFLRDGTGYCRKDYLTNLKFPTGATALGPPIKAGDFGEILVSDYLEFLMGHWVPRTRYGNKIVRDESSKGTDLIGFKLFDENCTEKDIMTLLEVKTQFSGNKAKPRLQDAIDGSAKDELRKAESLNAMKQRLFDKGNISDASRIARFQNPVDKPYKQEFGAAALFSTSVLDRELIKTADTGRHPSRKNLFLIVISADDFMDIANKLYQLAADEA